MKEKNCFIIVKLENSGEVTATFFDKSKIAISIRKIDDLDENGNQQKDEQGNIKKKNICANVKEAVVKNEKGEPMFYNSGRIKDFFAGEKFENFLRNLDISKYF